MLQASVQTDTTPGARPQPWPSLHGDNIFKITYLNNDKFKLLWIVFKFFFSSFQIESGKKIYSFSSEVRLYVLYAALPPVWWLRPLFPTIHAMLTCEDTRAPLLAPAYCPNFPQLPRGSRARDGAAIFCLVKWKIWEICIEQLWLLGPHTQHSTGLVVLTAKKYFQPCMKLARYNCSNILKLF